MFLRKPAADENATARLLPSKSIVCSYTAGRDTGKSVLGKQLPGKLSGQGKLAPGQERVRTALGDLTNAQKSMGTIASKKSAAPTATVPEAPIEALAGKGWRALQQEMYLQEEDEVSQRLNRIAQSARSWNTSYLEFQGDGDSSDDEVYSELSSEERYPEVPIVVQLFSPMKATGEQSFLPSCNDALSLLPEVPEATLSLDFCFSDDE